MKSKLKYFLFSSFLAMLSVVVHSAVPVIENLSGEVSVVNGGVNYTLPLSMPEGINGIKPSLVVSYGGSNSATNMGAGFSLDVVTSISRCTPSLEKDGFFSGLERTNNTRFCIGGEKLTLVKGTTGSDGAEYRYYRDSNHRVISHGGSQYTPEYWTVESPDGYLSKYEKADSFSTLHAEWLLVTKEDQFGNRVSYSYSNDVQANLESISYSGVVVDIGYETRSRAINGFQEGSSKVFNKRVNTVDVKYGNMLWWRYKFGYETVGTRSLTERLRRIQKCYFDQSVERCTDPLTFDYDDQPNQYVGDLPEDRTIVIPRSFYTPEDDNLQYWERPAYSTADLNNDGYPEFCYFDPGKYGLICAEGSKDGYQLPNVWLRNDSGLNYERKEEHYKFYSSPIFQDLDVDGYVDVCFLDDAGIKCALNNKNGMFGGVTTWSSDFNYESGIRFIKFNQDDLSDVCGYEKADGAYACYKNSGTNFNTYIVGFGEQISTEIEVSWIESSGTRPLTTKTKSKKVSYVQPYWTDIDADLDLDLCWVSTNQKFMCKKSSRNTSNQSLVLGNPLEYADLSFLSDVPAVDESKIYSSSESSHLEDQIQVAIDDSVNLKTSFRVVDLNGDSNSDICYMKPSLELYCRLNDGTKFQAEKKWLDMSELSSNEDLVNFALSTAHYGDVDFDGLPELCLIEGESRKCAYNSGTSFSQFIGVHAISPDFEYSQVDDSLYHNFVQEAFESKTAYIFASSSTGYGLPVYTGDLNGDGFNEFCYRSIHGVICSDMQYHSARNRLVKITDAWGSKTEIQYEPLLSSGNYEDGQIPTGYIPSLSNALVVTAVLKDSGAFDNAPTNPSAIQNKIEYRYGPYVAQPQSTNGGFVFTRISNPNRDMSTVSEFYLDGPRKGREKHIHQYIEDVLVNKKQNAIVNIETENKTKKSQLTTAKEWQYDLTGNLVSTTVDAYSEYDGFGYAKRQKNTKTSVTGEYVSVLTETNFVHDTDKWTIARPDDQTVTHTSSFGDTVVRKVDYTYKNGILQSEVIAPEQDVLKQTISYQYYDNGLIKKTISKAKPSDREAEVERTVEKGYDDLGRVKWVKNALNQTERYVYSGICGPDTHTDIKGMVTTTEYDFQCRKTKQFNSSDSLQTTWNVELAESNFYVNRERLTESDYNYKNVVRYKSTESVNTGQEKISWIDINGRTIRSASKVLPVSGANRYSQTDTLYDRYGRATATSLPYFETGGNPATAEWVKLKYDNLDRISQETKYAGDGSILNVSYTYDADQVTQQYGTYKKITKTGVNGKPEKITENGLEIKYKYNSMGDLVETDRSGLVTTIKHDERGNKSKQIDPAMGTWEYKYNGFGELYSQQDATNSATTFKYDVLGRKTHEINNDGTTTWVYNSGGDGIGQLHSEAGSKDNTYREYSYDPYGRIKTSELQVDGKTFLLTYHYDNYSRVTSIEYPDGLQTYNEYNEIGEVNMITMPADDFTDYNYSIIQTEYQALVKDIIAIEAEIQRLQDLAHVHLLKFIEYSEWASYYRGLEAQAASDLDDLKSIAKQHEDAARAYLSKAEDVRKIATKMREKLGDMKLEYKGVENGKYKFKRKWCAKRARRLGIPRCTRRKSEVHYFSQSELNDIDNIGVNDPRKSIKYFDSTPKCWTKSKSHNVFWKKKVTRCEKVKPHEIYTKVAERWEELAEEEKQAQQAANDLIEQPGASGYHVLQVQESQQSSWIMVGLNMQAPIPATVRVQEKVWVPASIPNAIANYQSKAQQYEQLAANEKSLELALIDDISTLQTDLADYQQTQSVFEQNLGYLNLESSDIDELINHTNDWQGENQRLAIWAATQRNEWGQLKSEIFGNGLYTTRSFDDKTGLLTGIYTGTYTGTAIRQLEYEYDQRNRITNKHDLQTTGNTQTEVFDYDNQNRLTDWTFDQTFETVEQTRIRSYARTYTYDDQGNFETKTGMGQYFYGATTGRLEKRILNGQEYLYGYDSNGNIKTADGRTMTWNSFNKIETVTMGSAWVGYDYDGSKNVVVKRTVSDVNAEEGSDSVQSSTTYYVSPAYEVTFETKGGETLVKNRHNIWVENDVVANYVKTQKGEEWLADQAAYYHRDIIGTGELVTGSDMEIISQRYYSPYGEELDSISDSDSIVSDTTSNIEQNATGIELSYEEDLTVQIEDDYAERLGTDIQTGDGRIALLSEIISIRNEFEGGLRGYTSHEEIKEVGLINMNARHYDPVLGRFLSADTIVPGIDQPLAFNRYSYVNGNPISYRDPSGHWGLPVAVAALFITSHLTDDQNFQLVGRVALGAYLASLGMPPEGAVFNAANAAQVAGAAAASSLGTTLLTTGRITNEDARGAAWSAAAAVATFGIGHGMELSEAEVYAGHAIAQGTFSHLQGGSFIQGAAAGLAGHAAGAVTGHSAFQGNQHVVTRTMIAASFGWAAAQATGGDGVKAAYIAATVHLYNSELSELSPNEQKTQDSSLGNYGPLRTAICNTAMEGCTPQSVYNNGLKILPGPGGDGTPIENGAVSELFVGPTQHFFNDDTLTVQNVALEEHVLSGVVTRQVTTDNNGWVYIETSKVGPATPLNVAARLVDGALWRDVDLRIRRMVHHHATQQK